MNILLSNDDGILAPGLAALYRVLCELGTVHVAAPNSVQSAMGHAITVGEAIEVRRIHVHNSFHGWSVGGRPADCVKLAARQLVDVPIDLVVSGINDGANVSINVLYSGTVAAAAEGALLGYPAIAVSLERGAEPNFEWAADIALRVIKALLADGLSAGRLVNVNVPDFLPGYPKGVRVATQAMQIMTDFYERKELLGGIVHYALDGEFTEEARTEEPESDLHALHEGYVVVTPLTVDLTDRSRLARLEAVDWPDVTVSG